MCLKSQPTAHMYMKKLKTDKQTHILLVCGDSVTEIYGSKKKKM